MARKPRSVLGRSSAVDGLVVVMAIHKTHASRMGGRRAGNGKWQRNAIQREIEAYKEVYEQTFLAYKRRYSWRKSHFQRRGIYPKLPSRTGPALSLNITAAKETEREREERWGDGERCLVIFFALERVWQVALSHALSVVARAACSFG